MAKANFKNILVMFQVLLAVRYYEYFQLTWALITSINVVGEELKDDMQRQIQILQDDLVSYLKRRI